MTTYKEPVSNQYACSKYGKTVTISWIMVSIPRRPFRAQPVSMFRDARLRSASRSATLSIPEQLRGAGDQSNGAPTTSIEPTEER